MKERYMFSIMVFVFFSQFLFGQNISSGRGKEISYVRDSTILKLHFKTNSHEIIEKFRDNEHTLHVLQEVLSNRLIVAHLDSVLIKSTASPEGGDILNLQLSADRGNALKSFIHAVSHQIPSEKIIVRPSLTSWLTLKEEIEKDASFPCKDKVLNIISDNVSSLSIDWKLRCLDNGNVWRYLVENYLWRYTSAIGLTYYVNGVERPYTLDDVNLVIKEIERPGDVDVVLPIIPPIVPLTVSVQQKHTRTLAIKTNLIYATALIANLGLEVELFPHCSVDIPVFYSPYNMFSKNRKIRILSTQPEVRWWHKSVFNGQFVGLHTHLAGYNVELNNNARYQDPNSPLWGFGASYGYARSLGENGRWGIEFNLGLGFAKYKYDAYRAGQDGAKFDSGSGIYWGVTRAGVSISYRCFRGKNKR